MAHPSLDQYHGLVQERRNSIANALGLRRSCTDPANVNHLMHMI